MHGRSFTRGVFALCLVLLGVGLTRTAQAQSENSPGPRATETRRSNGSLWRAEWPAFRTSEGVLTLLAGVGTAVIVAVGPTQHPRWQGGILFDSAVRNEFRAKNPQTRARYRTVGNYTYHLSPVLPLFDAVIVSTIGHADPKLALNLSLVTLEAYSYTGLSAFVSTELSARARPDSTCKGRDCATDTQSFFSGHAAIAATGAGLVCANHTRIALWGSPVADIAACVLASTNALLTASTRVAADRHYASDVIIGESVGFSVGYLVPVLLHYSYANSRSLALEPARSCGGNCLTIKGTF